MTGRSWWALYSVPLSFVDIAGGTVAALILRAVVEGAWGESSVFSGSTLIGAGMGVSLVLLYAYPAIRPSRWFKPIDGLAILIIGAVAAAFVEGVVATLVRYAS